MAKSGKSYTARVEASAKNIQRVFDTTDTRIGLILGSGLGSYPEQFRVRKSIPYATIGFPPTSVAGHNGVLHHIRIGGKKVFVLQGRTHYYEGADMQEITLPVRALIRAGVDTLIVTCASGSVCDGRDYQPGTLCFISDHINLTGQSPLRGENCDTYGPRFPSMGNAYDEDLRDAAYDTASDKLHMQVGDGVYAMMPGPAYETPAEVRMAGILGADFVGMSTVPEVLVARHMNAKVLGITCITNYAAGVTDAPLSHEDVVKTGNQVAEKFSRLITAIITNL
jgi:purine-nucleoside phosphorylase